MSVTYLVLGASVTKMFMFICYGRALLVNKNSWWEFDGAEETEDIRAVENGELTDAQSLLVVRSVLGCVVGLFSLD